VSHVSALAERGERSEAWFVRAVVALALLNGLLGVAQALLVRFVSAPRLFSVLLPLGVHHWSRSLTAALGLLLVYLSFHLARRSRVAWWLTLVVSVLAVLAHLGWGDLWYTALLPAATALLLLGLRSCFTVRTEPRSILRGLALASTTVGVALAYGTLGFWLLDRRDFGLNFHAGDSLLRTIRELTLTGNPDLEARTRHARWFLESLRLLGATAGLVGVASLLRPVAYRVRTLPAERAEARDMLSQHGRSALDFFKLWPDKSYFFSDTRRSFIAYRVAFGIALGLGDPTGPDEEIEATVIAFRRFCRSHGWRAAFHHVLPDLRPMYGRLGFHVLKIGEVAVVDLERFATETVERREFRRARGRFRAGGYVVTRHPPPQPTVLLDAVEEVSNEWLSLPGRREREFTLGRFDRTYLRDRPLAVLRDPSGRAVAFVNEIPSYRAGEATIDLIRHRPTAPHGSMDYLMVELLLLLRRDGVRFFSLGLTPLAGVGDRPGAGLQERAVHQLFERLNRFFSYKGLRHYKAKFEPTWEDRFLIYEGGPPGLVRAALALARLTEG
jgi:phosphatidylglycerol lysyltransferase